MTLGDYTFMFEEDWAFNNGPVRVIVEDINSDTQIASWELLDAIAGPHLNISMDSVYPLDDYQEFYLRFTCENVASSAYFDISHFVFHTPYLVGWTLKAPNILAIYGYYNSVAVPEPQEVFTNLHVVPEPVTVVFLGFGGLLLRKRRYKRG